MSVIEAIVGSALSTGYISQQAAQALEQAVRNGLTRREQVLIAKYKRAVANEEIFVNG